MAKKKTVADTTPPTECDEVVESEARPDFEETLADIETIVRELEGGALSLDESLQHYESAVGKMRQCYRLLEVAERRVSVLAGFDADGNPVTQPLEDAGDGDGNDAQTLREKQKTRGQRRGASSTGRAVADRDRGDDVKMMDAENEDWK